MSFDLSIVQIFSALTSGATVCVASTEIRKDPSLLAKFMQEAAVSVTYFTPTHFALLIELSAVVLSQCSSYRLAFFAGERLSVRLVNAFHGLKVPATVLNTWSPSELVVQTTIHKVTNPQPGDVNIPIGYPLANCRHYIVDSRMNPLPPSLVGEICVGGAQVGAGYLNRPDANSKSFVEDPFCSEDDLARGWTRAFKTGDKGRFLPDGHLEFHGRIAGDKQVKLRGFRIDLGEVEHHIYLESSKIPRRKLIDISVVARSIQGSQSLADERQLIAFIVCSKALGPTEMNEYVLALHLRIKEHLNAYMLPNGYQFLDELPVTIGGKVDRQSLLTRDLQLVFPSKESSSPSSEGNTDEKILKVVMQIFKDVLKLPEDRVITPTDNFFEVGGQSILLMRLQAKLKRSFKKNVPSLPELFKAPTPLSISHIVSGQSSTPIQGRESTVNDKNDNKVRVDWRKEAQLPSDGRYVIRYGTQSISRSDITATLLTGVDSFIGLHMVATLLSSHPSNIIYVLGSETRVEGADLLKGLHHYKLLSSKITEQLVLNQVRCITGSLAEPHFGLGGTAFRSLGRSIQSIYHLGGRMSLLKSYADLKRLNVGATLDLIELAAHGQSKTEIHYLSTWSVPHLQTHPGAKRNSPTIDITEGTLEHFQPSEEAELVYFKSRWVSEMLLSQAATRGFSINIFRSSAVTASTTTNVPEPDDDFVRRLVLDMISAGSVPQFGHQGPNPFVIDFIPVNYLTTSLCDISTTNSNREPSVLQRPSPSGQKSDEKKMPMPIYHITNPRPLKLQDLPPLMSKLRADGKPGSSLPLQDWLDLMKAQSQTTAAETGDEAEAAQLRFTAIKSVIEAGHVMFALDRRETKAALEMVNGYSGNEEGEDCPGVDEGYLRKMMMMGDRWVD